LPPEFQIQYSLGFKQLLSLMTNTYKKQLQEAGVNLDKALNRFMGNEAMYDKFLFSFTQEKSFGKLEESLNNKDIKESFMLAHTMKGIVSNLEIQSLLDLISPMTEQLRNGNMEGITEQWELLKSKYNEVCNLIKDNH
jgi:HPt (histidine-containing phosphotransfer) domain-containing protein